ncbi:MAG: hypothetical protein MMC33_010260 [Icmadophila ericetorum]|nr:hypothetical protein [Icmadophila ericetorum]
MQYRATRDTRDLTWESKIPLCTSRAFVPLDVAAELARPASRIPVRRICTAAAILPGAAVATNGSSTNPAAMPLKSCLKQTSPFGGRSSNSTKVKFAEFRKETDIPIVKYNRKLWFAKGYPEATKKLVKRIPRECRYWKGPYTKWSGFGSHRFRWVEDHKIFVNWPDARMDEDEHPPAVHARGKSGGLRVTEIGGFRTRGITSTILP